MKKSFSSKQIFSGQAIWTNKTVVRILRKYWQYYLLLLAPMLFYIIFLYLPIAGNIIAFRRYQMGGSIFGDEWSGLRYFRMFLSDMEFWRVFVNTWRLSISTLVFTFPIPIIFALLLNELRNIQFKRIVQTISYLPHFLSMVIIVGILQEVTSPGSGVINQLIEAFGGESINFMIKPEWFAPLYIGSAIWQDTGWNAIIYLAALTAIDPQLYEAARIDGANRWKQTIHITLAGIIPTITVLFILAIGKLLMLGYEKVLLMYNQFTMPVADILSTFVYRKGINGGMHSYATAVGLFESIIAFILVFSTNRFSRKLTGDSLW